MSAIGIIPARYASTRFPGKPLAMILGKPMIQWVYERALLADKLESVIIATDDNRIFNTVAQFGGNVEMTSPDLSNGTERIAEVAQKYHAKFFVNIQGDEPAIDPASIDRLVSMMEDNPESVAGTLVRKIDSYDDLINPNLPKVVIDKFSNAIYFSRSAVPFNRDEMDRKKWLQSVDYFQHIGIYIYQKDFLLKFVKMPPTTLEKAEKLEQLRILENGYKIKVAETSAISVGVDVPDDIKRVEQILSGSES